jgi:hypothetical protein
MVCTSSSSHSIRSLSSENSSSTMTTKTDSPPLTSIVLVTLLEIGDDYGSCSSAITTALRAKVKLSFVDESFLILKKKCEIFT